jgi:hypoxanthine phosphoribosyltransferase
MPAPRTNARWAREESSSDNVLELSWDVFGELCRALAIKVAQSGYRPDLVVGIAKAGVIPGAVVASILRCDFFSMKISRDVGVERVRARPKIFSAAPREAANKRVLIVDEIATSGETLRMALNAMRQVAPADMKTAVSFAKGKYEPDFYSLRTEATIVFPWDRQIVDEAGELLANPHYEDLL